VTTYDPNPTIYIDDVAISDDSVLNSISIRSGRNDLTVQPEAGYAAVNFWTTADVPYTFTIGQKIRVDISTPSLGDVTIFGGIVSDIDVTLEAYGQEGSVANYSIGGTGYLSLLNKTKMPYTPVGAIVRSYALILEELREGFYIIWDEVAPTLTWENYDPTLTWDDLDVLFDYVDPLPGLPLGDYDLSVTAIGVESVLSECQTFANSARGILYERPSGKIRYEGYLDRDTYTAINLTDDDILAAGLSTQSSLYDIANTVTVTYTGGEETNGDGNSQIIYGKLEGTRDTVLAYSTDAADQALAFAKARSYPKTYPRKLTIPLHSPTVSDATRDELSAVFCGSKVSVTNLPAVFDNSLLGFVENIQWEIKEKEAYLTLGCSERFETYPSQVWAQIPYATTWSVYDPLIQWEDLI
jgi:hypothetical protein